jgi:hypothetical protein
MCNNVFPASETHNGTRHNYSESNNISPVIMTSDITIQKAKKSVLVRKKPL